MKPTLITTLVAFTGVMVLGTTGLVALGAPLSNLPPAQVQGEATYITGGVGDDQASAFKQAAAAYPLELLFAQKAPPHNVYVADVKVTVRDASGKPVLETTSDGPFLLAKLPAGRYDITANYNGQVKRQAVDIRSGKHQRKVFVWAAQDDAADTLTAK